MKLYERYGYAVRSIGKVLPALLFPLLLTGCNGEEPMNWVDLRFLAEDSYELTASDPEPIVLQVKSTDPWIVYGQHDGWCTILPSEGGPDELFEVTVTYTDNTELDDRIDTLIIQSDYWIGKWVKVFQHGTAYLDFEGSEDILLPQEGGDGSFGIKSNQKWRIYLRSGSEWLTVNGSTEGEGDGTVSFSAPENKGEMRYAELVVYDRHDEEYATVTVTQDGMQLDPEEILIRTDYKAKEYRVAVVSNAEWTVVKDDPNMTWYSFAGTSFNGNGELVIDIDENQGASIRTATFTLETTAVAEGITPVRRQITLQQAMDPPADRTQFDQWSWWSDPTSGRTGTITFNGDNAIFNGDNRFICSGTNELKAEGQYIFRIASMSSDAYSIIYFLSGNNEIRWHLNAQTRMTECSTRPDKTTDEINNVSFDPGVPHELALDISRTEAGYLRFEWILDGESLGSTVADGQDGGPLLDRETLVLHVGATRGTVEYDYMDYKIPFDEIEWN